MKWSLRTSFLILFHFVQCHHQNLHYANTRWSSFAEREKSSTYTAQAARAHDHPDTSEVESQTARWTIHKSSSKLWTQSAWNPGRHTHSELCPEMEVSALMSPCSVFVKAPVNHARDRCLLCSWLTEQIHSEGLHPPWLGDCFHFVLEWWLVGYIMSPWANSDWRLLAPSSCSLQRALSPSIYIYIYFFFLLLLLLMMNKLDTAERNNRVDIFFCQKKPLDYVATVLPVVDFLGWGFLSTTAATWLLAATLNSAEVKRRGPKIDLVAFLQRSAKVGIH